MNKLSLCRDCRVETDPDDYQCFVVEPCDRHAEQNVAKLEARVLYLERHLNAEQVIHDGCDKTISRLTAELEEAKTYKEVADIAMACVKDDHERMKAELDRVKEFVVEKCGPVQESTYSAICHACGNTDPFVKWLKHAPDCMWKAMGGGNG